MKLWQVLVCPIVLMAILIPNVVAQYADLQITVDETGNTILTGTTNTDILSQGTQEYTSKDGELWMVNITGPYYKTLVYELHLPKNAQISFLKSSVSARIASEGDKPLIIGVGNNDSLDVVVQYSIEHSESSSLSLAWQTVLYSAALIIIVAGILFMIPKHKKHKYDFLPKRQAKIIELLEKNGPMTLTQLNEHLNLPKASLSRNIASLEKQQYLKKRKIGMSTRVELCDKKDMQN